jgi:curli biogenesis system outer membrane secretion channel CsgG
MGKMVLVITILSLLSISVLSEDKSTVAVLDLQVLGGLSSSEALILSEKVREALFLTGKFKVLDRSTMDEILKEQGFSQSGCTSDECIVQVGRMLSAQKMVAGSVGKIGGTYTLSLKLVDVQTGEIDNMA